MKLVEEIRTARQAAGTGDRGGRLQVRGLEAEARDLLESLARVELVDEISPTAMVLTAADARLDLPVSEEAERRRHSDVKRMRAELEKVEAKLSNGVFRDRAPAEIVAKEEARAADLRAALGRVDG